MYGPEKEPWLAKAKLLKAPAASLTAVPLAHYAANRPAEGTPASGQANSRQPCLSPQVPGPGAGLLPGQNR